MERCVAVEVGPAAAAAADVAPPANNVKVDAAAASAASGDNDNDDDDAPGLKDNAAATSLLWDKFSITEDN